MHWYHWLLIVFILPQPLFVLQVFNNYRYVLKKYRRNRAWYRPRTTLIVPCKGLDAAFDRNISSFFTQDYDSYSLWFVVEDTSDPAYSRLMDLKARLAPLSTAAEVRVLVAGRTRSSSQKIHNLLYCCDRMNEDVEVLAFADSDACLRDDWLSHIVYPLRQDRNGVATGYRWFIPQRYNPATIAMCAVNAKVAQLLGNTIFNQVWGGSMAIKVDLFNRLGVADIWRGALSDDLTVGCAVKKAGLKVAFVPACVVASYQSTTWAAFFEFGRRQFLITRVCSPGTWWFGFFSIMYSVLGLWGGLFLAIWAATGGNGEFGFFAAVPAVFFLCQFSRAIIRQRIARHLLRESVPRLRPAMAADMAFFWLWGIIMLVLIVSSAWGRTIVWRGIRYRLLGPTRTEVLG